MSRRMMLALALAGLGLTTHAAGTGAAAPTRDYMRDRFEIEQVLDWGDRPVWSPDGKRIAFVPDVQHPGPVHEIDVASRKVRCLTCRWGASGQVVRVYYLPDGSYLLLAADGLRTAEATLKPQPQPIPPTVLYWMPADLSMPPQKLGASAFGEIAIDYDHSPAGAMRIAWGEYEPRRMLLGDIVHDGKQAALVNRTILYDKVPPANVPLVTYTETYDFIDEGKAVLFFTGENSRPSNGMYRVDLATGAMAKLPSDGQHNEMHAFPDDRFGLEESNRASDPSSPFRGITGHRPQRLAVLLRGAGHADDADALAQRYGGKPFDLFVKEMKTGKTRRLTTMGDAGGEAHQSSPARDGKRVVFTLRPPTSGPYAGKKGLFVGTFYDRK